MAELCTKCFGGNNYILFCRAFFSTHSYFTAGNDVERNVGLDRRRVSNVIYRMKSELPDFYDFF